MTRDEAIRAVSDAIWRASNSDGALVEALIALGVLTVDDPKKTGRIVPPVLGITGLHVIDVHGFEETMLWGAGSQSWSRFGVDGQISPEQAASNGWRYVRPDVRADRPQFTVDKLADEAKAERATGVWAGGIATQSRGY